MAGGKKPLVEVSDTQSKEEKREEQIKKFIDLVKIVRTSNDKTKVDIAFNEIVSMMHRKIKQVTYRLNIPGCHNDDLYQEALFALRYKAIKDYDQTRSNSTHISPFDSFAVLCIRRHLSTKLKSSFQSKQIVINQAISIDQDRSVSSSEDNMNLSDILTNTKSDINEEAIGKESYKILLRDLWERMSDLEKKVFAYYKQDFTYEQIACKVYEKKKVSKEETKSVDNALSRIKSKAKWIYDQNSKND